MFKKVFRFFWKTILWFFAISIGLVIVFKWVPIPVTPLMVIRTVQQATSGEKVVWKHDWESIDNISKNLQLAVICSEDQNFLNHYGFDMKAIEKAITYIKKASAPEAPAL
mgnify:FL=1